MKDKSGIAKDRLLKESIDRLKNTYEQAKLDGNTDLMKKIKLIMERLNGKKT